MDRLDTSNIIGLEYLNEGIKEYLENIFGSEKVDLEDCFVALDFAISKKNESLSECSLNFIGDNLQNVTNLPRFRKLTNASVLEIPKRRENKLGLSCAKLSTA